MANIELFPENIFPTDRIEPRRYGFTIDIYETRSYSMVAEAKKNPLLYIVVVVLV